MGSFGEMLWIIHSVGLYAQISANLAVDNQVSGNALFTEVPHDVVSQAGDDVEMACSFRGASSSSVSLEIQWWYTRHSRDWAEQPAWTTNQESLFLFVVSQEKTPKGATKISVVKVVGSNISHKLRLSSIRPSDEGTYECRVIDFSESRAQRHSVQAYLQVQPDIQQKHNRDQKIEEENTSEQNTGLEEHQKIHNKREEQRMRHVAHQFHKEDHHQLHGGNKTTNQRAEI
ncbi:V-set and transmembrane domain-containing protein 2-like protein [Garra rufa]|uniref:V-set and transmembrane domain-containing protein 2-like protein n=1 Tax=Garra rufa TaxID=137080 RepID=UPI003CCEAE4E